MAHLTAQLRVTDGAGRLKRTNGRLMRPSAARCIMLHCSAVLAPPMRQAHLPLVRVPAESASSERLSTSPAVVRAALDLRTRGWACVPSLIPQEECAAFIDDTWDWLASLGTGLNRDDPSTWADDKRFPPEWKPGSGIIKAVEVAHQHFVWRMRSDPRVTNVFAALWGTEALLSSFDSINVMRPLSVTSPAPLGAERPAAATWWHTDQAPHKTELACVQGLLNLSPVGPHAGTLQVRDGSHMGHQEFWREISSMPAEQQQELGDWYLFSKEEYDFWNQYPTVTLRNYPAGSLFLWDSRTVHQNCPPADPDLWRHVLYTCYQPAALASPNNLATKQEAYRDYRLTTHWPAQEVTMNEPVSAEERQRYQLPRTRDQVENDTILRLAGMKGYDGSVRTAKPLLEASFEELEALLAAQKL